MYVRISVEVFIWYAASITFSLFLQDFFNLIGVDKNWFRTYTIIGVATFVQSFSCWTGATIWYAFSRIQTYPTKVLFSVAPTNNIHTAPSEIKWRRHKVQILFLIVGVSHTIGTSLMNLTLSLSNIPCVHTVRCLEPLLAGLFVKCIHTAHKKSSEDAHRTVGELQYWLSIMSILGGAALATWRSGQCTRLVITIGLGMLTNLVMVVRNICIQNLSGRYNQITTQWILYGISSFVSIVLLLIGDVSLMSLHQYIFLLSVVGICSAIYNTASISICSRINLVSHSLLTVLKRPVVIIGSAVYFQTSLSIAMIIGNVIAGVGIVLYKIDFNHVRDEVRRRKYYILGLLMMPLLLGTLLNTKPATPLPSNLPALSKQVSICWKILFLYSFGSPVHSKQILMIFCLLFWWNQS